MIEFYNHILNQKVINNKSIILIKKMSEQMRKSLLTNKSAPFQRLYEECLVKIQRIKQKNDFLQRQTGAQMQDQIAAEVRRQRDFLQHEIQEIKEIMDEIQHRFRDPESKNKLKTIKTQAQKQIQRHKIIMKDVITKSFLNKSRGSVDNNDDQGMYMQGGQVNYNHFSNKQQIKKQSIITQNNQMMDQQNIEIDYEIERKMLKQKSQLLNEVQQTNLRVNAIMNDMALQVNEQGQNLDVISEQLLKAHKNVGETNQALDNASKNQKKSKKKYIILILLIILIIATLVGVFIIKGSS